MDLFDNTPDRPKPVERTSKPSIWSYSRRSALEQCPRTYYYRYYGSNKTKAKSESQKKRLRTLKALSNRYLLAGKILHVVIRKALMDLRGGEEWSLERMQSWAQSLYEENLAFSRSYNRGDSMPSGQRDPSLLLEYYYTVDNADMLCQKARDRLMKALEHFANVSKISHLRLGARGEHALIEEYVRFETSGVTISGTVDLAYPAYVNGNRRFKVIDWKLGGKRGGSESLQLLAYGLAIANHYDCKPEEIDLYRVRLASGEVDFYPATRRKALQARCRVLQDMDRLQLLHEYGLEAERNAFPPCRNPKVCALCEFQEFCP